ncbi:MAG: hypothetical protein AB1755_05815 [Candidatus Omnitrophota bacterium]
MRGKETVAFEVVLDNGTVFIINPEISFIQMIESNCQAVSLKSSREQMDTALWANKELGWGVPLSDEQRNLANYAPDKERSQKEKDYLTFIFGISEITKEIQVQTASVGQQDNSYINPWEYIRLFYFGYQAMRAGAGQENALTALRVRAELLRQQQSNVNFAQYRMSANKLKREGTRDSTATILIVKEKLDYFEDVLKKAIKLYPWLENECSGLVILLVDIELTEFAISEDGIIRVPLHMLEDRSSEAREKLSRYLQRCLLSKSQVIQSVADRLDISFMSELSPTERSIAKKFLIEMMLSTYFEDSDLASPGAKSITTFQIEKALPEVYVRLQAGSLNMSYDQMWHIYTKLNFQEILDELNKLAGVVLMIRIMFRGSSNIRDSLLFLGKIHGKQAGIIKEAAGVAITRLLSYPEVKLNNLKFFAALRTIKKQMIGKVILILMSNKSSPGRVPLDKRSLEIYRDQLSCLQGDKTGSLPNEILIILLRQLKVNFSLNLSDSELADLASIVLAEEDSVEEGLGLERENVQGPQDEVAHEDTVQYEAEISSILASAVENGVEKALELSLGSDNQLVQTSIPRVSRVGFRVRRIIPEGEGIQFGDLDKRRVELFLTYLRSRGISLAILRSRPFIYYDSEKRSAIVSHFRDNRFWISEEFLIWILRRSPADLERLVDLERAKLDDSILRHRLSDLLGSFICEFLWSRQVRALSNHAQRKIADSLRRNRACGAVVREGNIVLYEPFIDYLDPLPERTTFRPLEPRDSQNRLRCDFGFNDNMIAGFRDVIQSLGDRASEVVLLKDVDFIFEDAETGVAISFVDQGKIFVSAAFVRWLLIHDSNLLGEILNSPKGIFLTDLLEKDSFLVRLDHEVTAFKSSINPAAGSGALLPNSELSKHIAKRGNIPEAVYVERNPGEGDARLWARRLAALKAAEKQGLVREVNGIYIIPVKGLKDLKHPDGTKAGQLGHIGLGASYGQIVVYVDEEIFNLGESNPEYQTVLGHEITEAQGWDTELQFYIGADRRNHITHAQNTRLHTNANQTHNVEPLLAKYGCATSEEAPSVEVVDNETNPAAGVATVADDEQVIVKKLAHKQNLILRLALALAAEKLTNDPYLQAKTFASIAQAVAQAGRFEQALALAAEKLTNNPSLQAQIFASIAQAMAQAGRFEQALALAAEKLPNDPYLQAQTFASIAQAVAQAGRPEQEAAVVFAKAIAAAEKLPNDPYLQAKTFASIAQAVAETLTTADKTLVNEVSNEMDKFLTKVCRETNLKEAPVARALLILLNNGFTLEQLKEENTYNLLIRFFRQSGANLENNNAFLRTLTPENIQKELNLISRYFSQFEISLYLSKLYARFKQLQGQERARLIVNYKLYYDSFIEGTEPEQGLIDDELIEETHLSIVGSTNLPLETYRSTRERYKNEVIPQPNFTTSFTMQAYSGILVLQGITTEEEAFVREKLTHLKQLSQRAPPEVLAKLITERFIKLQRLDELPENLRALVVSLQTQSAIQEELAKAPKERNYSLIEQEIQTYLTANAATIDYPAIIKEIITLNTQHASGTPTIKQVQGSLDLMLTLVLIVNPHLKQTLDAISLDNPLTAQNLYTLKEILTEIKPEANIETRQVIDEVSGLTRVAGIVKQRITTEQGTEVIDLEFIPAKTSLDYFFGYLGEDCTKDYPQELLNPNFTPIRIIENGRIVGSIYTLTLIINGKKSLVIVGIEPRTPLANRLNAEAFVEQLLNKLTQEIAQKNGYEQVLVAVSDSTGSNRVNINVAMVKLTSKKANITQKIQENFPADSKYSITNLKLWYGHRQSILTRISDLVKRLLVRFSKDDTNPAAGSGALLPNSKLSEHIRGKDDKGIRNIPEAVYIERNPGEGDARLWARRLAALKAAEKQGLVREVNGIYIIPVKGLKELKHPDGSSAGQLGHIGLGASYGQIVVYMDEEIFNLGESNPEYQTVLGHEITEAQGWDAELQYYTGADRRNHITHAQNNRLHAQANRSYNVEPLLTKYSCATSEEAPSVEVADTEINPAAGVGLADSLTIKGILYHKRDRVLFNGKEGVINWIDLFGSKMIEIKFDDGTDVSVDCSDIEYSDELMWPLLDNTHSSDIPKREREQAMQRVIEIFRNELLLAIRLNLDNPSTKTKRYERDLKILIARIIERFQNDVYGKNGIFIDEDKEIFSNIIGELIIEEARKRVKGVDMLIDLLGKIEQSLDRKSLVMPSGIEHRIVVLKSLTVAQFRDILSTAMAIEKGFRVIRRGKETILLCVSGNFDSVNEILGDYHHYNGVLSQIEDVQGHYHPEEGHNVKPSDEDNSRAEFLWGKYKNISFIVALDINRQMHLSLYEGQWQGYHGDAECIPQLIRLGVLASEALDPNLESGNEPGSSDSKNPPSRLTLVQGGRSGNPIEQLLRQVGASPTEITERTGQAEPTLVERAEAYVATVAGDRVSIEQAQGVPTEIQPDPGGIDLSLIQIQPLIS